MSLPVLFVASYLPLLSLVWISSVTLVVTFVAFDICLMTELLHPAIPLGCPDELSLSEGHIQDIETKHP